MTQPEMISVESSISAATACENGGVCDPLSNLETQRVWLFSGSEDTVVYQGVMAKLYDMYTMLMPNSSISGDFSLAAEHSWPTNSYGSSCSTLGSPYINNCDYDASYIMMSALTNQTLAAPVTANSSSFYQIDQDVFAPGGSAADISMGPNAYVYVPAACAAGAKCTLVLVFHGCHQTLDEIGSDFIVNTGMNELAEANNFVVLYPQVIISYSPVVDISGCFDWFGFTSTDYANQKGPQMVTVNSMAQYLIKNI